MKQILAVLISVSIMFTGQPYAVCGSAEDVFFEDFNGTNLNPDLWLTAEKNWGGTVTENGKTVDYNGGVTADHVSLRDGNLVLTGMGNQYTGEQYGINRDGTRRSDGKRSGGAIATKAYYASGSYEIRAKIAPELGCCSAMWTFEYEEHETGDALRIINHEIDIEFPGRDQNDDFSLAHALCTTWITEEDYRTKSAACGNQADGAFHTYRFDWHTGSDTETPRVEYYFDDELTYTAYDFIPTNESRFWLGLWFPKNWAGTPDFDTTEFVVDYVKITPFHESGDTPQHESYPEHGWAEPAADLPRGWMLWHSYSQYAALDSKLHLRAPDGTVTEITGDFIHAMNGSFGVSPAQFTFMAIDPNADEWDIFLCDNGVITNLTANSGERNEDPKFSPDGTQIVWKRGRWDQAAGDFRYDLALMNPETKAVTMLTDTPAEEAMPCFSGDGQTIWFTSYTDRTGTICSLDPDTHKVRTIFQENGVNAYYPVAKGDLLYFTKWYSSDNHCDQILCYDGADFTAMPFLSADYDCSDACPLNSQAMIYSSTANGDYDLYYFDGRHSARLTDLCSEQNDLGAAFFAEVQGDVNCDGICNHTDAKLLQTWLLTVPDPELKNWHAADYDGNNRLNALDLCCMKQDLLQQK